MLIFQGLCFGVVSLPRSFFPLLSSISWQESVVAAENPEEHENEKLSNMISKKPELQSMFVLSTCIMVLQHFKCIIYTYHTFITPWKINIEPTATTHKKKGKWSIHQASMSGVSLYHLYTCIIPSLYGGFLKWWYPKMDGL